jgi:hypothetical protein
MSDKDAKSRAIGSVVKVCRHARGRRSSVQVVPGAALTRIFTGGSSEPMVPALGPRVACGSLVMILTYREAAKMPQPLPVLARARNRFRWRSAPSDGTECGHSARKLDQYITDR